MSVPRRIMPEHHPAWFEIDLGRFCANLAQVRKRVGQRLVCCILKANAYGHGIIPIAKAAEHSRMVDSFGVAHLSEAILLRNAGISLPILVLGAIHEDQIEDLICTQVEFTVGSLYKAKLVAEKTERLGAICPVHVEVDTGMRRTGVRPESVFALIEFLLSKPCFSLKGVYSHFAMSETPDNETSLRQIESFIRLKEKIPLPGIIWHLANSGGIAFYPDSWLDMVRPGLLCYGLTFQGALLDLQPCMELKANVSYFKVVEEGEGISYGHIYRTDKQTRVVTIPVGYGDGYRRDFSNRMQVLLRNKSYRIAGAVCMDQFMVDIGGDEAYVGDEAVLIGRQGDLEITLEEMAKVSGTDPREILCHFNERIPRVYL